MREKWTVNRISDETLIDRRTINKMLGDTKPMDSDGKNTWYFLSDFIDAFRDHIKGKSGSGDLEAEKTRLTAAQADIAEVERAKRRHEVIDTTTAFRFFENLAMPIRRVIELSALSNAEKDRIFEQLEGINIDAIIEATLEQDADIEETGGPVPAAVQEAREDNGVPVGGAS